MTSSRMSMEIVCFSFNRGRLLLNAIMSARFCCPRAKVTIFDDRSDDRETLQIIDRLNTQFGVRVLKPELSVSGTRGGLHNNIRAFIERYATEQIVLLMQDDTQFFRIIESADDQSIANFYHARPRSIFLYPMIDRHRFNPNRFEYCEHTQTWVRRRDAGYAGYSAVCLVHVERAQANLGVFGESEEQTSSQALKECGPIAHLPRSFLVYLPAPYTVRGKSDAFISRWWRKKNTGVHPISFLRPEEAEKAFVNPKVLPNAYDHLVTPSLGHNKGWPAFHLQGAPRWLWWADLLEQKFRRSIQALWHATKIKAIKKC